MSDLLVLILQWLLVLNPLGATLYWRSVATRDARADGRRADLLVTLVAAFALLVLAVLLGESIIDALDISPPNWRIAAGVLLILGSLPAFVSRRPFTGTAVDDADQPRWFTIARMTLWLAGPASLGVAIAHGVDRETARVIIAILVAMVVTAAAQIATARTTSGVALLAVREVGRLTVAGAVILALRLIMDGVDGV